jgi:hypothetical protein
MSEKIVIYNTEIGQPINDIIKIGTKAFNIPNLSTAEFKMRYWDSEVLKVNEAATIVQANSGKVGYTWKAEDLDEPGQYFAWWKIDVDGAIIESDEFPVIVATHSPGLRTRIGAIYNSAKSFMPVTWSKLEGSDHYGDAQLQNKVDIAKLGLLGYEISAEDESNLDIRVINYLAKIAVISVIPAGKDYWASMAESKTAGTPDEVVSYPDRIEMLDQLHEQLVEEIAAERDIIGDLIDLPTIRRPNLVPEFSPGTDEGYITPNPNLNFRDYGFEIGTNRYGRRRATKGRRII